MSLSALGLVSLLSTSAFAEDISFASINSYLTIPDGCSLKEKKGAKINTYMGKCKGMELDIIFQEASHKALKGALQNIREKPPSSIKEPELQDTQVSALPNGGEMTVLAYKGKDAKGTERKNMHIVTSSADKKHAVMLMMLGALEEDKAKLNNLTRQLMSFKPLNIMELEYHVPQEKGGYQTTKEPRTFQTAVIRKTQLGKSQLLLTTKKEDGEDICHPSWGGNSWLKLQFKSEITKKSLISTDPLPLFTSFVWENNTNLTFPYGLKEQSIRFTGFYSAWVTGVVNVDGEVKWTTPEKKSGMHRYTIKGPFRAKYCP